MKFLKQYKNTLLPAFYWYKEISKKFTGLQSASVYNIPIWNVFLNSNSISL